LDAALAAPTCVENEPGLHELSARVCPWLPSEAVSALETCLRAAGPEAPLHERTKALVAIAQWLSMGGRRTQPEAVGARLSCLVLLLRQAPSWRQRLAQLLRSVLAETTAVPLFADTGLPSDHRFLSTAFDRLARQVLPEAPHERDLAELVGRVLPGRRAGDSFEQVPAALLADFVDLFEPDTWLPVRASMIDSLTVLAVRVSALGLHPELRVRGVEGPLESSPFVRIVRSCQHLTGALETGGLVEARVRARSGCLRDIEGCRLVTNRVRANLEELGVSVDLVYRLELIEGHVSRIETLIPLLLPEADAARGVAARRLVAHLARARSREQGIRSLVSSNVELLTRKIIERAGATGEHYITSTRAEYRGMLRSALGGGAVTTVTVVVKTLCLRMNLAPFFEGLFPSLNYAISFLALQLLGFTLATKQPSVTAAALAGSLKESEAEQNLEPMVNQIGRITRSQLAAVVGNLSAVAAGTLAFHYAYLAVYGRPFLDKEGAEHVMASLHPLESGAAFFAVVTGFLLWSSSIVAGWLENWAVYRKLPEGIARHRGLVQLLGERRTQALSRFFAKNVSGFGGNISLGFMLGMLPTFGKFFGIPLEVRHVTLSTGSLTLASAATPQFWREAPFWWAVGGLAVIGLLNFAVSFSLALAVAVRARRVPRGTMSRLARALLVRFRHSPAEFILPPKAVDLATARAPSMSS
jgi:site-specific recombinase